MFCQKPVRGGFRSGPVPAAAINKELSVLVRPGSSFIIDGWVVQVLFFPEKFLPNMVIKGRFGMIDCSIFGPQVDRWIGA